MKKIIIEKICRDWGLYPQSKYIITCGNSQNKITIDDTSNLSGRRWTIYINGHRVAWKDETNSMVIYNPVTDRWDIKHDGSEGCCAITSYNIIRRFIQKYIPELEKYVSRRAGMVFSRPVKKYKITRA